MTSTKQELKYLLTGKKSKRVINHSVTHGPCRLHESQIIWGVARMTQQGVGIQDGIGKSEWWWFRLEFLRGIIKENIGPKFAKFC